MTRTLILLAHPRFATSRANRALLDAAATVPGTEVADLYGLYPDGRIDTDAEVARLLAADRIVLQSPCSGMPRRRCSRIGRTPC